MTIRTGRRRVFAAAKTVEARSRNFASGGEQNIRDWRRRSVRVAHTDVRILNLI